MSSLHLWFAISHQTYLTIDYPFVPSSQYWTMATLFNAFQVDNIQKRFVVPFFWGHPGTVQLAQGHTSWLFSQEAQWGIELPTSGSAFRYLNHWATQPAYTGLRSMVFGRSVLLGNKHSNLWLVDFAASSVKDVLLGAGAQFLLAKLPAFWVPEYMILLFLKAVS